MALTRKKMQINASVDVGKGNTCTLLVGVQTGADTVEIRMEFPHIIVNRSTTLSSHRSYPKGLMSFYSDICLSMYIAALFVTARE